MFFHETLAQTPGQCHCDAKPGQFAHLSAHVPALEVM